MKRYKLSELCGFAYESAIKNTIGLKVGEIADFEKLEEFAKRYWYDENGNIIV